MYLRIIEKTQTYRYDHFKYVTSSMYESNGKKKKTNRQTKKRNK